MWKVNIIIIIIIITVLFVLLHPNLQMSSSPHLTRTIVQNRSKCVRLISNMAAFYILIYFVTRARCLDDVYDLQCKNETNKIIIIINYNYYKSFIIMAISICCFLFLKLSELFEVYTILKYIILIQQSTSISNKPIYLYFILIYYISV